MEAEIRLIEEWISLAKENWRAKRNAEFIKTINLLKESVKDRNSEISKVVIRKLNKSRNTEDLFEAIEEISKSLPNN